MIEAQTVVTEDAKAALTINVDVLHWLSKVGIGTQRNYVNSLTYYLKCVGYEEPSALLDLKGQENTKTRFFPAERLAESWIMQARSAGLTQCKIKSVMDAVRSFYKHNRVPLIQVRASYKPKAKESVTDKEFRLYREGFNFYGKILFDFILSVPIRDGQFQQCRNCGEIFYPRWRHITTYPRIEAYSPFVIKPAKGHESENYHATLRQVCFLTETAAQELNLLRNIKEKALGRPLKPDEFIFTHQGNNMGTAHVTPIGQPNVCSTFQSAWKTTGVHVSPHLLRSYVNSILATRGIDKQLRDIYLGHSCAYEEGYVMQLVPQWQQTFRKAKAMEHIDIVGGALNAYDAEEMTLRMEQQAKEIADLKTRLETNKLDAEDALNFKKLLAALKSGKNSAFLRKEGGIIFSEEI